MDVARVLLRPIADLAVTDVPDPVLTALRESSVRTVHMIGRRGPEHAKFTTKELKELGGLGDVDVIVDPADLVGADDGGERHVRANLAVLNEFAARPPSNAPRRLVLQFWRRPVAVLGSSRVTGLRLVRTGPSAVDVGREEDLEVGVVLRAAGYRSLPLPGVPFDAERGVVSNVAGRVVGPDGEPVPGEYVAGWLKRGPTGVIGTNKSDAHETVRSLLADVVAGTARRAPGSHVPARSAGRAGSRGGAVRRVARDRLGGGRIGCRLRPAAREGDGLGAAHRPRHLPPSGAAVRCRYPR